MAHRDDVVGHRVRSVDVDRAGGGCRRSPSSLRASSDSWSRSPISGRRVLELVGQDVDAFVFAQRRVVGMHAGPGQQLGDHFFVDVGVLPHVQIRTGENRRRARPPAVGQAGRQPARCCRWRAARRRRCRGRPATPPVSHTAVNPGRGGCAGLASRICGGGGASAGHGSPATRGGRARRARAGSSQSSASLVKFVGDRDQSRRHRQLLLQRAQLGRSSAPARYRPRCRWPVAPRRR